MKKYSFDIPDHVLERYGVKTADDLPDYILLAYVKNAIRAYPK